MITIITKEKLIKFNLKTGYTREVDLCQTISSLKSKDSNAKINIITSFGETFTLKVQDIIDFKLLDSEYIKDIHVKKKCCNT